MVYSSDRAAAANHSSCPTNIYRIHYKELVKRLADQITIEYRQFHSKDEVVSNPLSIEILDEYIARKGVHAYSKVVDDVERLLSPSSSDLTKYLNDVVWCLRPLHYYTRKHR